MASEIGFLGWQFCPDCENLLKNAYLQDFSKPFDDNFWEKGYSPCKLPSGDFITHPAQVSIPFVPTRMQTNKKGR